MSDETVGYQALELGRKNERDISAHEDLCAERYGNIHTAIGEIKGAMRWAGGAAFSIIIGMLGFLVIQQLNTNSKLHDDNTVMVRQLQQQLSDERTQRASAVAVPQP